MNVCKVIDCVSMFEYLILFLFCWILCISTIKTLNMYLPVCSNKIWKTQKDDGGNKTTRFVKNNLITLKLHSKEQHHHREPSLCIGFSPSLFNHRVNGASVAATVTTCGLSGNMD